LRYTGSLKTEAVNGHAGLWMRLDGEDGRLLSLDNMSDRPLSGTQDWARHEIVLDMPAEAARIVFGAILSGAGRVWFDDARLEVADPASPVTAPKAGREVYNKPPVEALPEAPRNLRFDE
jgi:hypothetical protein